MKNHLRVLVAGFGSEYRGDGAAGIILAERVHRFLAEEPGVEASLLPELFPVPPEVLAEFETGLVDLVVLCDADDMPRGEGFSVSEFRTGPRDSCEPIAYSAGAEWFLALTERRASDVFSEFSGKALFLMVSGDSFDFSEKTTPVCTERIEKAEASFRRYWKEYAARCGM
jgi:Ni,Fe-hydrogenase maturation factor